MNQSMSYDLHSPTKLDGSKNRNLVRYILSACQPSNVLPVNKVRRGLRLITTEGMATEAMTTFTSGTFLVAIALYMGARPFHIGLLAAIPLITNLAQPISIRLVDHFNNRKAITVVSNFLARLPLILLGLALMLFPPNLWLYTLAFFLFFHYLFGSIAGPVWNSWMKDLIPVNELGKFFSRRTRAAQILNLGLSFALAFLIDSVQFRYPSNEIHVYGGMFLLGGVSGMVSVYLLYKTPEPLAVCAPRSLSRHFTKPFKDKNFRKLLGFQSFWIFSANLVTPFFTMYLFKYVELPLPKVIGLNVLTQLSAIATLGIWGKLCDRLTNKTVIRITAPVYISCILSWTATAFHMTTNVLMIYLASIAVLTGITSAGINLAMSNMGIKLTPKDDSVSYMSVKNIITSFVGALGPFVGGAVLEILSPYHLLWGDITTNLMKPLCNFQTTHLLFITGGLLAMVSLVLLRAVKENKSGY